MRSYRATNNLIAVSAMTAEVAVNAEQTPDTVMQVSMSDVINVEPRRENDAEELTGREEPSLIYDMGQTAAGNLTFDKAQPQHFGFLCAYALGKIATAAAGDGYEHTVTPIAADVDAKRANPSFTLAMRFADVLKRRFASAFVDQLTATFARDEWVKINGQLKLTGKTTDNVIQETVEALDNVVALTLAENGVHGADAGERLDSIHRIDAELTSGIWTPVVVTGVSAATPAVLTIESAGGAGTETVKYRVLYRPVEAAAWMTFPAKVVETPLRVSEVSVNFGGSWSGSAFVGGRTMTCEAKQIEWSFQNNLQVEFCFGEAGNYAGRAFRDGRTQTVKVDREFRDMVVQRHIADNDTFGLRLLARGAAYEEGHHYQVEIVFPKLGVIGSPISVDGKRLAESAELSVLEHDTHGSVIVKVKNKVATYAA